MNERTKTYRVKRYRWREGEPHLDKVMFLTEPVYKEAMKRKKHPSGSGDVWFEDYAYRWYELHRLRLFFAGLWAKIHNRYTKADHSKLFIRDILVVVIGGIILWCLTEYLK